MGLEPGSVSHSALDVITNVPSNTKEGKYDNDEGGRKEEEG